MTIRGLPVVVALLACAAAFATPADDVAAADERLDAALAARDAKLLEPLVAPRLAWVHSSDGRVDDRRTWLDNAARGMALSGQRVQRTAHGATTELFGSPAHTAIRIARVRLLDAEKNREMWLRQTRTWVREGRGPWRLVMGQGVVMYDGPTLDAALHARYAGVYLLPDGRKLTLEWSEDSLLATLPSGAQAQVFLESPTDEVVRVPTAGSLHFTLADDGTPRAASLMRLGKELWRADRR